MLFCETVASGCVYIYTHYCHVCIVYFKQKSIRQTAGRSKFHYRMYDIPESLGHVVMILGRKFMGAYIHCTANILPHQTCIVYMYILKWAWNVCELMHGIVYSLSTSSLHHHLSIDAKEGSDYKIHTGHGSHHVYICSQQLSCALLLQASK